MKFSACHDGPQLPCCWLEKIASSQKTKKLSTELLCIVILFLWQVELEDLKVLRRSPDLLNNVKIVQGQLQLIMKQILFYHIYGLQPFWSSDLNNPMNTPSKSPVISEEKMFK